MATQLYTSVRIQRVQADKQVISNIKNHIDNILQQLIQHQRITGIKMVLVNKARNQRPTLTTTIKTTTQPTFNAAHTTTACANTSSSVFMNNDNWNGDNNLFTASTPSTISTSNKIATNITPQTAQYNNINSQTKPHRVTVRFASPIAQIMQPPTTLQTPSFNTLTIARTHSPAPSDSSSISVIDTEDKKDDDYVLT